MAAEDDSYCAATDVEARALAVADGCHFGSEQAAADYPQRGLRPFVLEERVDGKTNITESALHAIRRELILMRETTRIGRRELEVANAELADLERDFEEQSALLVAVRRDRVEAVAGRNRYREALAAMGKEVAKLRAEVVDFSETVKVIKEHKENHAGRTAENQESVGSA